MDPSHSPPPNANQLRPHIDAIEIGRRQQVLRELAADHGWEGIAFVGRGGGTYDRHGGLLWACGHYQAFPNLPDRPPLWSGRAHAVFTLPVEGRSTLLTSAPELGDEVVADEIVTAEGDFGARAAALLAPVAGGGLVGADAIPWPLARAIEPDRFTRADAELEALLRRKSHGEIAVLRHACAAGTAAVDALMRAARPDATEGEAIAAALAPAARAGAMPYLVALAVGDRATAYTGRPLPGFRAERQLIAGEVARLDLVLVYEGYFCDFGRSWVIGGPDHAAPATRAMLDGLRAGLDAAVAAAVPGATAGAIARAGARALPSDLETAYPPHWGHGLGTGWEGPWLLPDSTELIEEGMTLAIEVAVHGPGGHAAAEQNVLVSDTGPELLTPAGWEVTP